jgi:WD40 repeat protein
MDVGSLRPCQDMKDSLPVFASTEMTFSSVQMTKEWSVFGKTQSRRQVYHSPYREHVSYAHTQWIPTARVESHKGGISSLCIYKQFVVTGSSDASVKIWTLTMGDESGTSTHWIFADTKRLTKIVADELREVQVLLMDGNLPLSLAITSLPQSNGWLPVILHPSFTHYISAIILAIGGTDRTIRIWTQSEDVVCSLFIDGSTNNTMKTLVCVLGCPFRTRRLGSVSGLPCSFESRRSVGAGVRLTRCNCQVMEYRTVRETYTDIRRSKKCYLERCPP